MILQAHITYISHVTHRLKLLNISMKKEYFRTLAQVIEAENALRHFVKVFYNARDHDIRIPEPDTHFEK